MFILRPQVSFLAYEQTKPKCRGRNWGLSRKTEDYEFVRLKIMNSLNIKIYLKTNESLIGVNWHGSDHTCEPFHPTIPENRNPFILMLTYQEKSS